MLEKYRTEVLGILQPEQSVYLATCLEGHPYVRPVTLMADRERFFIATGSSDAKVSQITLNPQVEICLPLRSEHYSGYLRVIGILEAVTDLKVLTRIYEVSTYVKNYWEDPSDPKMVLYEMHWKKVEFLKPGEQYPMHFSWREDRFSF